MANTVSTLCDENIARNIHSTLHEMGKMANEKSGKCNYIIEIILRDMRVSETENRISREFSISPNPKWNASLHLPQFAGDAILKKDLLPAISRLSIILLFLPHLKWGVSSVG